MVNKVILSLICLRNPNKVRWVFPPSRWTCFPFWKDLFLCLLQGAQTWWQQRQQQINFRPLGWRAIRVPGKVSRLIGDAISQRNSCWRCCWPYLGIITSRKVELQLFVSCYFSFGHRMCFSFLLIRLLASASFQFSDPRNGLSILFMGFYFFQVGRAYKAQSFA